MIWYAMDIYHIKRDIDVTWTKRTDWYPTTPNTDASWYISIAGAIIFKDIVWSKGKVFEILSSRKKYVEPYSQQNARSFRMYLS